MSIGFKNVVVGAVNTLIVCWAECPTAIMDNHEELARELVDAWSSAYPEAEVWTGNDYGLTSGTEESDEVPAQSSAIPYSQQNHRTSTTSSATLRSSDQGVAQSNMTYGSTNSAVLAGKFHSMGLCICGQSYLESGKSVMDLRLDGLDHRRRGCLRPKPWGAG
eukprot:scaffold1346_cov112-Cylindrotheca_fusiformis.AAC.1